MAIRHFVTHRVLPGLAALILVLSQGGSARADEMGDALQAIADGYSANKAAFKQGTCRFTYSIGSADSEEDAIKGKWNAIRKHASAEATMYFKDDLLTLKMKVDKDGRRNVDSIVTLINVARKGSYAIDHDPIVNNSIVFSPANPRLNIRIHPFNLAMDSEHFDPASVVAYRKHKDFMGRQSLESNVKRDGHTYCLLRNSGESGSHDSSYYIDPTRGYLAFITEWFNKPSGTLFSRMRLLSVHQEGNAFFPMRAIHITPRNSPDGPDFVDVREMKVVSLDLSYQPTAEDLTIRLPKETQYYDGVNPNTAKTLFGNSKDDFVPVSVNDIEPIYHQLQAIAKEREAESKALKLREVKTSSP